jgi:hypothetical protein
MTNIKAFIGLGVLLIVAGLLFLLQALGLLPGISVSVWTICLSWAAWHSSGLIANRNSGGGILLHPAGHRHDRLSEMADVGRRLVPAAIGVSFWIIYLTGATSGGRSSPAAC